MPQDSVVGALCLPAANTIRRVTARLLEIIEPISTTPNRQALILHGQRLEYFTIGYHSAEGRFHRRRVDRRVRVPDRLRPGQRYRSGVRGGVTVAAPSRLEPGSVVRAC